MRTERIVLWIIMALLLVFMLWLAFRDAAETGEPANVVGAVAAWVAIVVVSFLFLHFRFLLLRAFSWLASFINDRIG